jgi:hypothetical protein
LQKKYISLTIIFLENEEKWGQKENIEGREKEKQNEKGKKEVEWNVSKYTFC